MPEELLAEQRAFHEAAGEDLLGLPAGDDYLARVRAAWDADDEPFDPAALLVRLGRTAPELQATIDAAALTYGCYDLAKVLPSQRRATMTTPILSAAQLDWHSPAYRGGADPLDPDVSPLWADLIGMPPALFSVGTADPFVDDSVLMAARWAVAGNEARLDVYPGAVHAFDLFGTGIGRSGPATPTSPPVRPTGIADP